MMDITDINEYKIKKRNPEDAKDLEAFKADPKERQKTLALVEFNQDIQSAISKYHSKLTEPGAADMASASAVLATFIGAMMESNIPADKKTYFIDTMLDYLKKGAEKERARYE